MRIDEMPAGREKSRKRYEKYVSGVCQYCGKEILGKPYIVGPKRLGMIYCSPECFWKKFDEKHPELAPKKESDRA